ncbi:hypothetical protein EDB84DRAFT_1441643 [Lactarius hengduanensis]|nr:hypothetical protein EDB84DRAFT_1441643 [Lactarius hengduanensis]
MANTPWLTFPIPGKKPFSQESTERSQYVPGFMMFVGDGVLDPLCNYYGNEATDCCYPKSSLIARKRSKTRAGFGGVKRRKASCRPLRGASRRIWVRGDRGRVGVEGLEPRTSAARWGTRRKKKKKRKKERKKVQKRGGMRARKHRRARECERAHRSMRKRGQDGSGEGCSLDSGDQGEELPSLLQFADVSANQTLHVCTELEACARRNRNRAVSREENQVKRDGSSCVGHVIAMVDAPRYWFDVDPVLYLLQWYVTVSSLATSSPTGTSHRASIKCPSKRDPVIVGRSKAERGTSGALEHYPARARCPNFGGNEWDFLRQTMIDANPGIDPLTEEGAAQRLREAWTRENDNQRAAWDEQLDQDRIEQEEQDRLAQEEEDAQQALRDKEAEQQRREAEKKKPKIGSFVKGQGVANWIEPRPAQYALNKSATWSCRDAAADTHKSISQDTLAFAQVEDTLAIRPLAAVRPSRNIRSDENLSWDEVMYAKNTMIHFMAQSGVWPLAHVESLAAFFVALELHPRRVQDNGNEVLILYQSRVRREWFDAFKRDRGFDIEVINEAFMQSLAETVNNRAQDRKMEQVRPNPMH